MSLRNSICPTARRPSRCPSGKGCSTVLLRQGDWSDVFNDCRTEAFHLEVRDDYAVAAESEPFRRFLEGVPDDYEWFQEWERLVSAATARGVVMRRVRVVTEPHTDYQRWGLVVAARNIAAGEDIRYLSRHLAGEVPPDDWCAGSVGVEPISDSELQLGPGDPDGEGEIEGYAVRLGGGPFACDDVIRLV
ncbi:DUF6879 family protein [Nocardia sp. N2S4-5]|uniref:DUF6879 family protein n=1 Tax=Nocardia sp. N2S4-5 TaxID=3351565 RepID=UPI0037D98DC5